MSLKKKPVVVITRKLPEPVETRMRELFDARLNVDDHPMPHDELAGRHARGGRAGSDADRPDQ